MPKLNNNKYTRETDQNQAAKLEPRFGVDDVGAHDDVLEKDVVDARANGDGLHIGATVFGFPRRLDKFGVNEKQLGNLETDGLIRRKTNKLFELDEPLLPLRMQGNVQGVF